jgi:hypothetical protein
MFEPASAKAESDGRLDQDSNCFVLPPRRTPVNLDGLEQKKIKAARSFIPSYLGGFAKGGGEMSAQIINFIIQIVAGAVGGNLSTKLKDFNLGPVGSTISGAIGGGLGGQILTSLIPALTGAGGVDIGTIVGQAVGGGVSGAILTAVVGLIKNALAGQKAI